MGTQLAALLAAIAVATAGLVGAASGDQAGPAQRSALVIDAAAARDGRELVDARLGELDAEVRLPRTPSEARTDVRYFAAQGFAIVVAGPRAGEAASAAGVAAERTAGLDGALAALGR
jgi:hypothetical protein